MSRMRKFIAGWIVFKIALLAVFWGVTFSACEPAEIPSALASPAPTATPVDETIDRETSDPYSGDVSRFEREGRAEKLQIGRVMDLLSIRDGSKVGDIGAGSGWFSVIASERVGKSGRVYAVDISEIAIKYIDERVAKEEIGNIETVLGKPDDPLLSGKGLDAALILNTYHEIANPIRFLINLKASLRSGARVGIIDRDGSGGNHGVDSDRVIEEALRAGFVLKEEHDFVKGDKMDYFLIFEPRETEK